MSVEIPVAGKVRPKLSVGGDASAEIIAPVLATNSITTQAQFNSAVDGTTLPTLIKGLFKALIRISS